MCCAVWQRFSPLFFFFNDTATTEIYTLSLHDALPISQAPMSSCFALYTREVWIHVPLTTCTVGRPLFWKLKDRKSTRLNSSHQIISYAVFCLKKKKNALNTSVEIRKHIHERSVISNTL